MECSLCFTTAVNSKCQNSNSGYSGLVLALVFVLHKNHEHSRMLLYSVRKLGSKRNERSEFTVVAHNISPDIFVLLL